MNQRCLLLAACLLWVSPSAFAQTRTVFVFARINDPVMPIERARKYEDPLDRTLKEEGLGEVTGGGSAFHGGVVWRVLPDVVLRHGGG